MKKELITNKAGKNFTVDAAGQSLGRLSAQIASYLLGKHRTDFAPHQVCPDTVSVINAGKVVLTGRKLEQKVYHHHTGYPGHLKTVRAKDLMEKNPAQLIERSVYGMLPPNKLRKARLHHLKIYLSEASHK